MPDRHSERPLKASLRDTEVRGVRVLVRVDFNVPVDEHGSISDDTRIRAVLPTIRHLLDHGAAVILMSHFGRPKGKVVESMRLAPVARRLSELLNRPVQMATDSIGPEVEEAASDLKAGHILLLENLRFHAEEEANDADFAEQLSRVAGLYVNDAFGAAHRAHASTVGVTRFLPAVSGLLMQAEIEALSSVLHEPARPLVALVGGAKISSKIGVLAHLLTLADALVIGGGMANTFLKAQGHEIGASLVENDKLDEAKSLMAASKDSGCRIYLPVDVVITETVAPGAPVQVVAIGAVPRGWKIVDIGPETVKEFADVLRAAGTVVWNGPMGVFEIPDFAEGTRRLACVLADSNAHTIVGGGDSVAAVEQMGVGDRIDHISTGGGASLEFLEGKELPGIAALRDAPTRGGEFEHG